MWEGIKNSLVCLLCNLRERETVKCSNVCTSLGEDKDDEYINFASQAHMHTQMLGHHHLHTYLSYEGVGLYGAIGVHLRQNHPHQ